MKHLKDWGEFVTENFQEKSVPDILKKISTQVRKDIINNGNNSFNKPYAIDEIDFVVKVNYQNAPHQPYYSNVNIYEILTKPENPVEIQINVTDEQIDTNYLMSIVLHELRHVYDVYTISDDVEINEFLKTNGFNTFKNTEFSYFIDLIYLSLEHELIARHNMLYELFRWINITDKDKLYEIFKQSYTYTALNELQSFNSEKFIANHDVNKLFVFTRKFITQINDNFSVNNINDLHNYYKKWESFFTEKSHEFSSYVNELLTDVVSDVTNNKVYERLTGYISYNEDIRNEVSTKLFEKMINYFQKIND